MIEALLPVENKNYTPLPALGSRLLIYVGTGDSSVLNPENKFDNNYVSTQTSQINFEYPIFTILEEASNRERRKVAGVAPDKLDQAIIDWAEKNAKVINKKKGNKAIGMILGVAPENAKTETMTTFYEKYFNRENNGSNETQFFQDVVENYIVNGTLNLSALTNDLPSIQSLAGAFGIAPGEILTQLIDAGAKHISDPKKSAQTILAETNNFVPGDRTDTLLRELIDGQTLDAPKRIATRPAIATPVPPTTEPPTEPTTTPLTETLDVERAFGEPKLTGRELFKKYKAASSGVEMARVFKKPTELKSLELVADQLRDQIYRFEDRHLPKLLGMSLDDIKRSFMINTYELGIRNSMINYTIGDRTDTQQTESLLQDIQNQLGKFNRKVKDLKIMGFVPNYMGNLVLKHDELLDIEVEEPENISKSQLTHQLQLDGAQPPFQEPPPPQPPKRFDPTPLPPPSEPLQPDDIPDWMKEPDEPAKTQPAAPRVEPPTPQGSLQQLGDDLKRAGADLLDFVSKPANIFEVASHLAEHAQQHVGSLEAIIAKVSESRGGVVELSMDSRGLTKILPQLVVDSINVAIHENVSKLLNVKLADEKIKDIAITNHQAEMELNLALGPITRTLRTKISNNAENTGLNQPKITINPPTIKNPIPFAKIKEYDLQQIVDDLVAKNTIDSLLKKQLGNHKDIKGKTVVENVRVFFDKDDQVHLNIQTKAP